MRIISQNNLSEAIAILKNGGAGAFPTDTIFGLGCSVFDEQAIERIYSIKHRDGQKGLPVLAGSIEDVSRLSAQPLSKEALLLASAFWPGKLTMVLSRHADVPTGVTGGNSTIAVRIPAHPITLALIEGVGPLVGTSANLSGQEGNVLFDDVARAMGDKIDFLVQGQAGDSQPSTVIDMTCSPPRILREGTITKEQIESVLQK